MDHRVKKILKIALLLFFPDHKVSYKEMREAIHWKKIARKEKLYIESVNQNDKKTIKTIKIY